MSASGKGAGSRVYKLVEIKELALYWNSDIPQSSPVGTSVGDDVHSMHSLSDAEEELVYLLRPTNVTLRLTVRRKVPQTNTLFIVPKPCLESGNYFVFDWTVLLDISVEVKLHWIEFVCYLDRAVFSPNRLDDCRWIRKPHKEEALFTPWQQT